MKSLADVARAAGVSKATASRALNGTGYVSGATRERVQRAAVDLGYVASTNAASLVTGRTRNIGVVTPYINRWFFAEVLDGIEAALLEEGYDLTLYRLRGPEEQRRRVFDYFLVRKRVDAVVAVGIELEQHDVRVLGALRKPVVSVGGALAGTPTVGIDDVAAATLATRHLLDLGHRRLVHLGGRLDGELSFGVHGKRLHGFRTAVASAGVVPMRPDYVPSALTIEDGHEAALTFLREQPMLPTAVVAASDELAIGTVLAARSLGLDVPGDLSVIGIDGHPLASLFGITTIGQDPWHQGATAARICLELLSGARAPGQTTDLELPLAVTVRTSTAPPPPS